MSTYAGMLDALVEQVTQALNIPATRDPSVVGSLVASQQGCIFIGFPTHVGRLLEGPNLEVPISLVAPAPSDLQAVNWLLDNIDALVEFAHARVSTNSPLPIGDSLYPAVTVTARIAL